MSAGFGVWSFLWLVIGCVIGFGGGILYLFMLGSAPEGEGRPNRAKFPVFLAMLRAAWTTAALFVAVGICYGVKLDKTLSLLVLLLAVLLILRMAGRASGLAASLVAGAFAAYFLPPDGSFRVASSEDQLALLLFMLATITASRFIAKRNGAHG